VAEQGDTHPGAQTFGSASARCCVYTCRFDNQVLKGKFVKKYFLVVKLAQYFVGEEDRKPATYCKQKI